MQTFKYITVDPRIMNGVPCIVGTRIPVSSIVYLVKSQKITPYSVINDYYPQLTLEKVNEAMTWSDLESKRVRGQLPS